MPADSIDFFHEATLRICGSLEIDVAAKDCLEYLQAYLPLDGISVHYYDEKNRLLLLLATASNIPLDVSHHAIPISLEGHQSFRTPEHWSSQHPGRDPCAEIRNPQLCRQVEPGALREFQGDSWGGSISSARGQPLHRKAQT